MIHEGTGLHYSRSFMIQETKHPHGKLRDQWDWSMPTSWKVCKESSEGVGKMYINLYLSR